jgi:hypothetical protein
MLQSVKSAEERWMDRVGVSPVPPTPSVFPADVVAIIYKPARSAMTSGKARTGNGSSVSSPVPLSSSSH